MIIKTIKKIFSAFFGGIYKIIRLLNLQMTILVLVVGLLLWLLGVLTNPISVIVFIVFLISSVFLAVFLTVKKIFNFGNKDKKKTPVQIVGKGQPVPETRGPSVNTQEVGAERLNTLDVQTVVAETPRYYEVKQNKNYLMAEFSDRYELYLKTTEGLKKVRTDYK